MGHGIDEVTVGEEITGKLMAAMEAVTLAHRSVLKQVAIEHGVSLLQLQVVHLLGDGEAHRLGHVADRLAVTRATLSDAVVAAARKGLVERSGDPRDARVVMLRDTPRGLALATEVTARIESSFSDDVLTDEMRAVALKVLLAEVRRFHLLGVDTTLRCCLTCSHFQRATPESLLRCMLLEFDMDDSELRVECPHHSLIEGS